MTQAKSRAPSRARKTAVGSALFDRLAKPHDLRRPGVPFISWEFNERSNERQVTVVEVSAPSEQVNAWGETLRGKLKRDTSWKGTARYSKLIGLGLAKLSESDLGQASVADHPGYVAGDPTRRISETVVGGILMSPRLRPIGYVTVRLTWYGSQDPKQCELDVELNEVWIAPKWRGQGYGGLLKTAVVSIVWRAIAELATDWPLSAPVQAIAVVYSGDVYSLSGDEFVQACYNEHRKWLCNGMAESRGTHLRERKITWDSRL